MAERLLKGRINVSGLHGQRHIHGERLCGHAHCSKKAGTKKKSSAVHLHLLLALKLGLRLRAGSSGTWRCWRRCLVAPEQCASARPVELAGQFGEHPAMGFNRRKMEDERQQAAEKAAAARRATDAQVLEDAERLISAKLDARLMPTSVRALITLRSNSARPPRMVSISRPCVHPDGTARAGPPDLVGR